MRDLRRHSPRLMTALALLIVAVVEIQAFASILQGQARLREKVTRTIRVAIDAARPRLAALMKPGAEAGWREAIREARAAALASEVAVLDLEGRVRAAEPASQRPQEDLTPVERGILADEGVVTVGPIMGETSRLLTYFGLRSGEETLVLRLLAKSPDDRPASAAEVSAALSSVASAPAEPALLRGGRPPPLPPRFPHGRCETASVRPRRW